MSKINAVRMINVNYNNNSMKISDEIFQMQGKTTLLSLRNGGGKSVMVQMMTAPFVHKKYRNTADRPFDSFFTSMKPSFIMVEWALDKGAGYCLTGMMVRKNQNIEDLNDEKLEMINFIAEYKERCEYDIYHLPVVEKNSKEIVLKPYRDCKQLFEMYKKEKSMDFVYYDMNNPAASRQYFQKLSQYQIYYKEWENIIRKVNIEESGLSKLFADCKDEKDLIEKWFLEAVENKLNGETNRVKGFQEMINKYVGQYRDNQSQIKKRENILAFKEDSIELNELSGAYVLEEKNVDRYRNTIREFLIELNLIGKFLEVENEQLQQSISQINEEIEHLRYEMLSVQVYDLISEQQEHVKKRELIGLERDNLEKEFVEKNKKLHLLQCAKQNEKKKDYESEVGLLKERKRALSLEAEQIEPERKEIGTTLRASYDIMLRQEEEIRDSLEAQIEEISDKLNEGKMQLSENETKQYKLVEGIARCRTLIEQYDKTEEDFNRNNKENFARNIMGTYEGGFLEICESKYKKELDELQKSTKNLGILLEENKEKAALNLKRIEEAKDLKRELSSEKISKQEQKDKIKNKLEIRRRILRYLEISEKEIWDTAKILEIAERKSNEIEHIQKELELQEAKLTKEWKSMSAGKILELPADIEEHLESNELQPVYGMEWLSKNGRKEEENKSLVEKNPFIPYALIFTKKQIEKLKNTDHKGIFSSFPIPIIERELLESAVIKIENGLISLENVHFYMMFNDLLLNQEECNRLIEKKKEEINQIREKISVRRQEYKDALERISIIANQKISEELFENVKQKLCELEASIEQTTDDIEKLTEEKRSLETEAGELQKQLKEITAQSLFIENRNKQFVALCQEYDNYQKNRDELSNKQNDKDRIENRIKILKDNISNTTDLLHETREKLRESCEGIELIIADAAQFAEYEQVELDSIPSDFDTLKARYVAITSRMSQDIKQLEEQLNSAQNHLQKEENELKKLLKKYSLVINEVEENSYNEELENSTEQAIENLKRQIELKDAGFHEEDKQVTVLESKISDKTNEIFETFHVSELLPKEEITRTNYEGEINKLVYKRKELDASKKTNEDHFSSVQDNLTALAEYDDQNMDDLLLKSSEEIMEIQNSHYFSMDRKSLRDTQGMMIRDLKHAEKETKRARDKVYQYLVNMSQKQVYREEDFQKCLEVLRTATEGAVLFKEQLSTVLQSYQALLEKLEVDLALIERERNEVEGLLLDYIKEVHSNLGMIDNNSTINIRNRAIKMLKLSLPNWEEQEKLYEVRLNDYIRDITEKSMALYDKNETPTEYIGLRITTKSMYDSIIGLANLQIKLYKIEEEREYPITWRDAAKNSGGEGFLSAFVILTALMYYMRKDDLDIFAERNEGKVLVMDNPFAQTNASHLLNPIMDMAKKTNTQLICLSGLGGDSIYNCFDNIYVLKMVNASLRGGLQYMKSNHIRGVEEEIMITSRIEVIEQQELLF